ncbi:hypothetical protein MTO96_033029 [Rhipicephalus appendiculatus]
MTVSPVATVRLVVLLFICGAVLADTTYSLKRGKPHHGKKGHHKNQQQHQDQGPDSDEYPPSLEDPWDVSEEDRISDASQNPGYPWLGRLPTFRLIHRGRLLPPLIEHAIPKNLSEDESLEPVTICGPGWHPPVGGHPPVQPRDSAQQAPLSVKEEEPRAVPAVVPFGARIARASDAIAASSSRERPLPGDGRLEPRLRKALGTKGGRMVRVVLAAVLLAASVVAVSGQYRRYRQRDFGYPERQSLDVVHSGEVPAPAAAPAGYKDISRSHAGVYVEEMSNSYVLGSRRRRRNRFRLLDVPNDQR